MSTIDPTDDGGATVPIPPDLADALRQAAVSRLKSACEAFHLNVDAVDFDTTEWQAIAETFPPLIERAALVGRLGITPGAPVPDLPAATVRDLVGTALLDVVGDIEYDAKEGAPNVAYFAQPRRGSERGIALLALAEEVGQQWDTDDDGTEGDR